MWTRCCIGDVLTLIQNGVNCKQDKSGVGQKVTRIETIADSTINYERTGFAKLDEKQRAKARLEKGDILFSHINSPIHVGKTAIYNGNEPLFHGINLLRLRTIEEVNSSYFNMFLISLFQSGYWKRTAKQSVNQASVNQTDIKSVPFSYPPLPVQKKIVEKLDAAFADIDKAISVTEKNIENNEALYQSILIETFENLNNPSIKYLGELSEVIAGQSPNGKFYNEKQEGVPFYQGKKLFGKKFLREPNVWTSKVTKIAKKNDLLISVRAPVGEINFTKEEICIGRGLAAIRVNSRINRDYLYFYLKRIKNAITGTKGAVFNSLNKSQIQSMDIPLVELNEQLNIVLKLNNLFDQIDKIKDIHLRKLNEYNSLKSSILNQAFSGELTKDVA